MFRVSAKNQVHVNVQCFRHLDQPQTTSKPYITTTEKGSIPPTNTTDGSMSYSLLYTPTLDDFSASVVIDTQCVTGYDFH